MEPAPGASQLSIDLPAGIHVLLTFRGGRPRFRWPFSLEASLFGAALLVYLGVRLVGLTHYPIYFFSDEAIQPVLAADLLRDNFKSAGGEFLPTYFYNVDKFSLGATVYLHMLPYLLFGKSVLVTRLTAMLLTILAAGSVALILRDGFKLPYWWSAALLLSATPAWFLHSRTAFETTAMASFYAAGLYAYLLYRLKDPRYLFAALSLFALAFYSYNPGQVVVVLTGAMLLLSDLRYHWRQRRIALGGLGLLALLALPYLRFRLAHPAALEEHLYTLGSYWIQPLPLLEKLLIFSREYLYGLSPGYWFAPNGRDLARHLMKDYGHLQRASLPVFFIGLVATLRSFRSPASRAVISALLAAPAGAALVGIAITRALVFVIPATILSAIGLVTLLVWLEKLHLPRLALSLSIFTLLLAANLWITFDALANGPTWYTDYGLSGQQFGARQVFGAVEQFLRQHPGEEVVLTTAWLNGADVVTRFFLGDPLPVRLGSIDGYLYHQAPLDPSRTFVMTPEEYQRATSSGKFTGQQVLQTLPYPDGRPGFYFVRLRYVDNIAEIMLREQELRRQLQEGQALWAGRTLVANHSLLDMGIIQDVFDGNPRTVTRTFEANPYLLEIRFPQALRMQGIELVVGDTAVHVQAQLYLEGGGDPVQIEAELRGTVQEPKVSLDFGEARAVQALMLSVTDLSQGEPGHVHIWEIIFH